MKRVMPWMIASALLAPATSVSAMVDATARDAGASTASHLPIAARCASSACARQRSASRYSTAPVGEPVLQPVAHLCAVVVRPRAQPRRMIGRGLDREHDQRGGGDHHLIRQLDLDNLHSRVS
jgi:hypothetical protein